MGDERTELTVDDILALGGEKEDLAMLANVDDGGDDCDIGGGGGDGPGEELKLDDIQSFVKKLGLPGFSGKTKNKEKLDTSNKDKEIPQNQPAEQSDKQKKKEKNKKPKPDAIEARDEAISATEGPQKDNP